MTAADILTLVFAAQRRISNGSVVRENEAIRIAIDLVDLAHQHLRLKQSDVLTLQIARASALAGQSKHCLARLENWLSVRLTEGDD